MRTTAIPAVLVLGLSALVSAQAQDDALLAIARATIADQTAAVDDPDARVAALLAVAERHGSSSAAWIPVARARALVATVQRLDHTIDLLESLLDSDPHPNAELEARIALTQLIETTRDKVAARAVAAFAGYANKMMALGPFGDEGNYYTHTPFACELRFPAPGVATPGRFGPVLPRVVERDPDGRDIKLEVEGADRDGCYYGLHQVVSDSDLSCYVEVTCFGSFELFVNGEQIAAVDRHRELRPGVLRFGVALGRGHNHVLVKTTLNGNATLAVRYLDAAGRGPQGLTEVTDLPRVTPHVPARPTADLPPFPDGLRRMARAASEAELGSEQRHVLALAAGLTAFEINEVSLGVEMLQLVDAQPPAADSPHALAWSRLWLDAQPIPAELARGRARAIHESASVDPQTHHYSAMQAVTFLEDDDKLEDGARLLERRRAGGQLGPEGFERLVGLYTRLHFDAEARLARDAWRSAFPLDTRPAISEAAERRRDGDTAGALALLQATLARRPGDDIRRRLFELATFTGDREVAEQVFAELHADDPTDIAAVGNRATMATLLGDEATARSAWSVVAEHEHASARQVTQAADALLAAGDVDTATAAYRRVLTMDPNAMAVRRLLVRLEHGSEFPALERFHRNGDDIIAAFEAGEREQGSSSTLVLDQMIVQFFADGSSVEETHVIRRINDLRGVEQYQQATAAARAGDLLTVRTIGVDGLSYVPNRVAGDFGMPRLEPGAFIELRYRNFSNTAEPGPWRSPEFHFQSEDEPYGLSEFVLILPADHPGSIRTRNFPEPAETVELENGFTAHVFRRTDVPRLPTERAAPPAENVVPLVTYGEDRDPEARARLSRTTASWYGRTTPFVADRTREVVGDLTSDLEKVRAIHHFVHDMIASANEPKNPTEILMLGRGARFYLEIAMLELAGVPVRRAVAENEAEEYRNDATPLFLGEESFRIDAALVEPRDGHAFWLFVDLPRYVPINVIQEARMGALALLLGEGPAELRRIPRGQPETSTGTIATARVVLDQQGGAAMEATGTLRGITGHIAAERMRALEEDVQGVVARQVASTFFPGWTLRTAELTGTTEKGIPLGVHATLQRERAIESAGQVALLSLPLAPTEFMARYGDRAERSLPMVLAGIESSRVEITIDPGPGFRFAEVPEPVRLHHMLIDFTLTFQRDGDRLIVMRDVVQRPGRVIAQEFGEWLELLRRLDLVEAMKLELMAR